MIELTRDDLLQILGVKNNTLKTIIRTKKLKERLLEKGYIYKDKVKRGRVSYYIVEVTTNTQDKESFSNICDGLFKTKKQKEFGDYYMYRTLNLDKPITKQLLSDLSNVSIKTITKWDKSMIENDLMTKDGYYYMAMEIDDSSEDKKPKYRLTCREEYMQFMKNNLEIGKRNKAHSDYIKGTIDKVAYNIIMDGTALSLLTNQNKIIYKVNKYQLNKAKIDLTKLIKELIIKVYKKDTIKYFIHI
ncbi:MULTISPECIES: hypothetical protein [unclassified Clostridium]|uniref:hypothetical protein n=1 Tax=unclassified Clostridium TaxID=2614128 RepID=UPI0020799ABE|nr:MULTISPECIES: hypothetical protein [unclassified Clostridium]